MLKNSPIGGRLREAVVPLLAMCLASRLMLLALAWVALRFAHAREDALSWTNMLCRWDCEWYLDIANHGYSSHESGRRPGETSYGFYPLFPLLLRLLQSLHEGEVLHAGIVVANLCFVAAIFYVYLYARELGYGHRSALLAPMVLCIFPQSIVFSAPYTESLCLLLLAAAIYHLRREQYLAAGVAAALLSAARPNGVLFIIFAVAWIWQRDGWRTLLMPWRAPEKFVPVVLAPLGMLAYLGYSFVTTGDAFAHSSTEIIGWGWSFGAPWENLLHQLQGGAATRVGAFVGIGVALCSLLLLRYGMYAEFAFCLANIALVWCSFIWSGLGTGPIFRYWLVLFPIWVGVARSFAARPLGAALSCALVGMVSGVMACAWALQSEISI